MSHPTTPKTYPRRNVYIDKDFQNKFILKFCSLVAAGAVATIQEAMMWYARFNKPRARLWDEDRHTRFLSFGDGFSVENDLSHAYAPLPRLPALRTLSTPRRANPSARSFSGCPAWPRTQSHSTR